MTQRHKANNSEKLRTLLPCASALSFESYELFELRGRGEGFDLKDWLQADQEAPTEASQVVTVPAEHSVPQSRRSFLGFMTSLMAAGITAVLCVVFAGL